MKRGRTRAISPLESARVDLRRFEQGLVARRTQIDYHTAAVEFHKSEVRFIRRGLEEDTKLLRYYRAQVRVEQAKAKRRRRREGRAA